MVNHFNVQFTQDEPFICNLGESVPGGDYDGPLEITPSDSIQVLPTRNKTLAGNITVNPIPSNYGLVEWNGSVLTVS